MSDRELDPSAIVGNQSPKAVEMLTFQCYERAWRGFAQDFRPTQLPDDRRVVWGDYVFLTFDSDEPGVIKSVYVETPEETERFAGAEGLREEAEERAMLALVLGIDVVDTDEPEEIATSTLSPEELARYDDRDALYVFGEAFGRQPTVAVNIDTKLARWLYDQALKKGELATDFETVSRHFIDVVEQYSDREPTTDDAVAEGDRKVALDLPLVPISLNKVSFCVRAELEGDGTHSVGRNYDITLEGNGGFYSGITLYAPYFDRPNGYFRAFSSELGVERKIELSDIERILSDIHQLEAAEKLHERADSQ